MPTERWPQLIERAPRRTISGAVAEPILACLAHEPAQRPTAAEVADRLEPVLAALPKPRLSRLKPRVQR